MVASQEISRVWLHCKALISIEDGATLFTFEDEPWAELEKWVLQQKSPVACFISPHWLFYLVPDGEDPRLFFKEFGLKMGHWQWQELEFGAFVLMPSLWSQQWEQLQQKSSVQLKLYVLPPQETLTNQNFEIFGNHFQAVEHSKNRLTWVPSDQPGPSSPPMLFENWVAWQTQNEKAMQQLEKWRGLLIKACVACLLLGALWFAFARFQTESYRQGIHESTLFLAEHEPETKELQSILDRGNGAWESLSEIQSFSRRGQPIAKKTLVLAGAVQEGVKWTRLSWDQNRFEITLESPQIQSFIQYSDRIRALDGPKQVVFDEAKSNRRNKLYVGSVTGVWP